MTSDHDDFAVGGTDTVHDLGVVEPTRSVRVVLDPPVNHDPKWHGWTIQLDIIPDPGEPVDTVVRLTKTYEWCLGPLCVSWTRTKRIPVTARSEVIDGDANEK